MMTGEHGFGGYKRGCRCEACVASYRWYFRVYARRRKGMVSDLTRIIERLESLNYSSLSSVVLTLKGLD